MDCQIDFKRPLPRKRTFKGKVLKVIGVMLILVKRFLTQGPDKEGLIKEEFPSQIILGACETYLLNRDLG